LIHMHPFGGNLSATMNVDGYSYTALGKGNAGVKAGDQNRYLPPDAGRTAHYCVLRQNPSSAFSRRHRISLMRMTNHQRVSSAFAFYVGAAGDKSNWSNRRSLRRRLSLYGPVFRRQKVSKPWSLSEEERPHYS